MTDKYLLFAGENYYPRGGWSDFKGYFDTIEEAKSWINEKFPNSDEYWAHIVFKDKIIKVGGSSDYVDYRFNAIIPWKWKNQSDLE